VDEGKKFFRQKDIAEPCDEKFARLSDSFIPLILSSPDCGAR
jgi:hypothetical protein